MRVQRRANSSKPLSKSGLAPLRGEADPGRRRAVVERLAAQLREREAGWAGRLVDTTPASHTAHSNADRRPQLNLLAPPPDAASTSTPTIEAPPRGLPRGALHELLGLHTASPPAHDTSTGTDTSADTDRDAGPAVAPPMALLIQLARDALRERSIRPDGSATDPGYVVWVGCSVTPHGGALVAARDDVASSATSPSTRRRRGRHLADLAARCIFIDVTRLEDRLWAAETAARCPAVAAVIADGSGFGLTETRRLQLTAEATRAHTQHDHTERGEGQGARPAHTPPARDQRRAGGVSGGGGPNGKGESSKGRDRGEGGKGAGRHDQSGGREEHRGDERRDSSRASRRDRRPGESSGGTHAIDPPAGVAEESGGNTGGGLGLGEGLGGGPGGGLVILARPACERSEPSAAMTRWLIATARAHPHAPPSQTNRRRPFQSHPHALRPADAAAAHAGDDRAAADAVAVASLSRPKNRPGGGPQWIATLLRCKGLQPAAVCRTQTLEWTRAKHLVAVPDRVERRPGPTPTRAVDLDAHADIAYADADAARHGPPRRTPALDPARQPAAARAS